MNSLTFRLHNAIKDKIEIRVDGKLHCTTGPAVYTADGNYQQWWVEGKQTRLDGPAEVNNFLGIRKWKIDDKLFRLDGPAIERFEGILTGVQSDHANEFFVADCRATCEEFDLINKLGGWLVSTGVITDRLNQHILDEYPRTAEEIIKHLVSLVIDNISPELRLAAKQVSVGKQVDENILKQLNECGLLVNTSLHDAAETELKKWNLSS